MMMKRKNVVKSIRWFLFQEILIYSSAAAAVELLFCVHDLDLFKLLYHSIDRKSEKNNNNKQRKPKYIRKKKIVSF